MPCLCVPFSGGGVRTRDETPVLCLTECLCVAFGGLTAVLTGLRAKAWCLLVHDDASLFLPLSLGGLTTWHCYCVVCTLHDGPRAAAGGEVRRGDAQAPALVRR